MVEVLPLEPWVEDFFGRDEEDAIAIDVEFLQGKDLDEAFGAPAKGGDAVDHERDPSLAGRPIDPLEDGCCKLTLLRHPGLGCS